MLTDISYFNSILVYLFIIENSILFSIDSISLKKCGWDSGRWDCSPGNCLHAFFPCFSFPYFTTFLVILGLAGRSLSEEALDPIDLLEKLPPPVKQVSHWPFLTARKYIIRKRKKKKQKKDMW